MRDRGAPRTTTTLAAALFATLALASLPSCLLAIGFDGYGEPGQTRYHVGGIVSGLGNDRIVLVLNDTNLETSDGPFVHPKSVLNGTRYVVTTKLDPVVAASTMCEVANGRGVIAGADVSNVAVTCRSSDASLAILEVGGGALTPSFDPTIHSYRARFGADLVAAMRAEVVAKPKRADAKVMVSEPTFDAADAHVTIAVMAPDGVKTANYDVTLELPPAREELAPPVGDTLASGFATNLAVRGDVLALTKDNVVEIHHRHQADWPLELVVHPDDPLDGLELGAGLAVLDDTVFIGSPAEDGEAGAVYVFRRSSDRWLQIDRLTRPTATPGARFGQSLAVAGATLFVGPPCSATATSCQDAIYLFTPSGGSWAFAAVIAEPYGRQRTSFGRALAVEGDELAVTAPDDASGASGIDGDSADGRAPGAGAAFVFHRESAWTWTREAYVKASNPRTEARFGKAVAISQGRLVVGGDDANDSKGIDAAQTNAFAPGSGAIYVFTRNGTSWSQQSFVKSPRTVTGGAFGSALAMIGSLLFVGAPDEDNGTLHVMAFGASDPLTFRGRVRQAAATTFAAALAIDGETLVVAAPQASDPSGSRGRAFVYDGRIP